MLHKDTGMPKVQIVTDEENNTKVWGQQDVFCPPLYYNGYETYPGGEEIRLQWGKSAAILPKTAMLILQTLSQPVSFVSIAAWAGYQRNEDITPYYGALKPMGAESQISGRWRLKGEAGERPQRVGQKEQNRYRNIM